MGKSFIRIFAQGLLVTVPLVITLVILNHVFSVVYGLLQYFHLNIHPYIDPLVIAFIVIVSIFTIGWLASSILLQPLFNAGARAIEHIPVIKHIYSPIKDFLEAFVGSKKRFTKPVLVLTNPAAELEEIGFITQENLHELDIQDKVAVYMPHSYAFSGKLIIVSKSQIRHLNVKGTAAMKFIVTGGVADLAEDDK